MKYRSILCALLCLILLGCSEQPINSPYPNDKDNDNTLYSAFTEQPKTLDPARSYSEPESVFTMQIYEPPIQYHYLLRPYQLVPLTAVDVPKPTYTDAKNQLLPENAPDQTIAYSIYEIKIRPDIFYQPHPAFAVNKKGQYIYHYLTEEQAKHYDNLANFEQTGTRELTADDYVYEIKRLASPEVQSPIFGVMKNHIVGFDAFAQTLKTAKEQLPAQGAKSLFLDLRQYPLEGASVIDRYTYRIKIKGKYPQFRFWLAMPFFAPIPWEADKFYSQKGLEQHDISLDFYPVGTGPYYLTENNPNHRMVLQRNPNFHGELFPSQGMPQDNVFLTNANKPLPFIDKVIFTLEKETVPYWNKFLQGYYDRSGVTSDSYDSAIHVTSSGQQELTESMKQKGIYLRNSVEVSTFYLGFNMTDNVVGGYNERARKLRQAISIALDYEEYISIFLNGRGTPAQSPIPPGIFGYNTGQAGMNPYIYTWTKNGSKRRDLSEAKRLLSEAGYPNGQDQKTGQPLVLNYDAMSSGGPDAQATFNWLRKQFAKLGIELQVRSTTYNRFQEKMRNGNTQLFMWGWSADYPDPENFLFLLYGPNSMKTSGGENAANYNNAQYDKLFNKMKTMLDTPERQEIINQMVALVQRDSPWAWGYHPGLLVLSHGWVYPSKPSTLINNSMKYLSINPELRAKERKLWNHPIFWPMIIVIILGILLLIPVVVRYWQREHTTVR